MTTTTEMTLTDRAVAELSEFNAMIESVQPYAELTVANDGIGKVEEAHKQVKRLNTAIEKKRKELKAGALEYGRTVDSIAKQLSSAVDKIEGKLGAEREAFEAAKEAERKAKEAEKLAALQKRIDRCQEIGVGFVLSELQSMADDDFEWWLSAKRKEAEKKKLGSARFAELLSCGFSESPESLAELSAEAWAAMFQEAQRKHADTERRIAEEREHNERRQKLALRIARMEALGVAVGSAERVAQLSDKQFEHDYQIAKKAIDDRKAAEEAKLKAEQDELNRQRAELQRQQEEIAAARREAEEKKRAEERARREAAAKPELEKLTVVIESLKAHSWRVLEEVGKPSWHEKFCVELDRFALAMEQHVREDVG